MASASWARSGAIARSAFDPDTQPQTSDAAPATSRQPSRVSAAGHQTTATRMTAPTATAAEARRGCTTRSGRFCRSSTSSTRAPSTEPRRVRERPSGASGISRRTSDVRVVASCRRAASWLASRSV